MSRILDWEDRTTVRPVRRRRARSSWRRRRERSGDRSRHPGRELHADGRHNQLLYVDGGSYDRHGRQAPG
ncbi:hypothetical protein AB5I41_21980 [Sphingomonas sp. MMS24-JH45]